MTHWCYGLKCLGLAFSYTGDTTMCRRRDTKSSDSGIVYACLNTFSLQKVHVIVEMAISI